MIKKRSESELAAMLPFAVDPDIIRLERNLTAIGFFGVNEARKTGRNTRRREQLVLRNGVKVKVASEIRGSDLGSPSISDQDKYQVFMKILSEERAKNGGQIPNPVCFSGARMLRELGIARTGKSYNEIEEWGRRMADTTITSERTVYFASKKDFANDTLHVFGRFRSVGSSGLDGRGRREQFEVFVADWVVDNLNLRYTLPEDFNRYKLLRRPVAKGIFGHLHIWFHASNGRKVEKDYVELCNLLDIKAYPHFSRIKQSLGPPLEELKAVGYLATWDIQPRSSQIGYKVVMTPGENLLKVLSATQRRLQESVVEPTTDGAAQQTSINVMVEHGIAPVKAAQLARTYNPETILDQIDYADSLIKADTLHRIQNPPGLIIYQIENSLPVPSSFMTSRRRREAEERQEKQRENKQRELFVQIEYLDWRDREINVAVEKRFPGVALGNKLKEIAAVRAKTDTMFSKMSPSQRLEIARQYLNKDLAEEMGLPSFKEWSEKRMQISMF